MSWEVLPLLPWFVGAIFSLRFQGAPLFTGVPAISLAGCSLLSIKCGLDYPLSVSAYGKSTLGHRKSQCPEARVPTLSGSSGKPLGTSCYKTAQPSGFEMHFSAFLWRHFRTKNTCSVLATREQVKADIFPGGSEVGCWFSLSSVYSSYFPKG